MHTPLDMSCPLCILEAASHGYGTFQIIKNGMLNGLSASYPYNSFTICLLLVTAWNECARALYLASAEDSATGVGMKLAALIIPPLKYNRKHPVLLPSSGQSCHDESVNNFNGQSDRKSVV